MPKPLLLVAIDRIKEAGLPVETPPSADPFALILWENVSYLASPKRRRLAFELLRDTVGLDARRILDADKSALERVSSYGILAEQFAEKMRECARIVTSNCDGDLDNAIRSAPDRAHRLLRQFPGIGLPGADKILLFMGLGSNLAPESNGLRVMERLGVIEPQTSYDKSYRSARDATSGLFSDSETVRDAHLLLAEHGRSVCRRTRPACNQCALRSICPSADKF